MRISPTLASAMETDCSTNCLLRMPKGVGTWRLPRCHQRAGRPLRQPACGIRFCGPGQSPDEPRILLDRREPLNEEFHPPFRLEVEDDWFALTKGKERKLDGEPGVSITRYQVIGDQMTRMQPLALMPEDFLDEWVQFDWTEAADFSSESPDLSKWHSILNGLAYDSTEIEFVQPCPKQGNADKLWLAGLWIDPKLNPKSKNERLYVVVSERHHAFFVDSINTTRAAGMSWKSATTFDEPGITRVVSEPLISGRILGCLPRVGGFFGRGSGFQKLMFFERPNPPREAS